MSFMRETEKEIFSLPEKVVGKLQSWHSVKMFELTIVAGNFCRFRADFSTSQCS